MPQTKQQKRRGSLGRLRLALSRAFHATNRPCTTARGECLKRDASKRMVNISRTISQTEAAVQRG
jgi:hypothetical protein